MIDISRGSLVKAILAGLSIFLTTAYSENVPKNELPTVNPETGFHQQQDSVSTNKGCVPPCRSGYVCVDGKCVELCNPPCPPGETCDNKGNCVSIQPVSQGNLSGPTQVNKMDQTLRTPSPSDTTPNDSVSKMGFFLYGGFTPILSPTVMSDMYGTGGNFGGGMSFIANSHVIWNLKIDYSGSSIDNNFLPAGVTIDGGSLTILDLLADLKISSGIQKPFSVFMLVGAGKSFLIIDSSTISGPGGSIDLSGASESALALSFGGGFDILVNQFLSFTVQTRYTTAFTLDESTHYLPVQIGLSFYLPNKKS